MTSSLGPANICSGGRLAWASAKAGLFVQLTKSSSVRHQVLNLVVTLLARICDPLAGVVVELHRPRAMHLVADEARSAIDEMNAPPKAVLEIDAMGVCDWNSIGDDDHARSFDRSVPASTAPSNARAFPGNSAGRDPSQKSHPPS